MKLVVIGPERALPRIRAFARGAGWEVEAAGPGEDAGLETALAVGSEGSPVLFVREGARVPRAIRRVLVPHEGSPAVAPGLEAADEASVVCGAEIFVLHVPSLEPSPGTGNLPAPRFADHAHYDWADWGQEFRRRFCRCSDGVDVRLEVATGPSAEAIVSSARRLRADLIVLTWKGRFTPGRAETVKAVLRDAPVPTLVVSEVGDDRAD